MAPSQTIEDYYMILQVEQTAKVQAITRSYRRLALELHPDRNDRADATDAFQRLGRAYDTLKDARKRREYDLIRLSSSAQTPPEPAPQPKAPKATKNPSDVAQLFAIRKSKFEHKARWRTEKDAFEWSIFYRQRFIQRIEEEIEHLDTISAAEAAAEARNNSWKRRFLSPLHKQVKESDEEKARKDIERRERRLQKDIKERRLSLAKKTLKEEEDELQMAEAEFDAEILIYDQKIEQIETKIELRREREREKAEKKRMAAIWRRRQEAAESLRK